MVAVATVSARVTVVAPLTRVDVTLPADATVAELVPQLVRLVGVPEQDPAASSGGWLLSRLGGEPFEVARTVAALGVADGDLLYLTPRNEQAPPAVFDDVVDAVARASSDLPGGWTPLTARRAALGAATAVLVGCGGLLPASGIGAGQVALAAGVVSVLLLGVSAALSRAFADSTAGAVTACAAVGYGVLGAVALPAAGATAAADRLLLQVVYGGVTLAVLAVGALLLVADAAAVFVGTAATGFLVTVAGLGAGLTAARPVSVAAVAAAVTVLALPVLPALALRLGRLRTPAVPTSLEEFRSDLPPVAVPAVRGQSAETVGYLTALTTAVAITLAGCTAVIATGDGTVPPLLAAAVAGAALLRVRSPLRQRGQRLALLAAGLFGTAAVTWRLVSGTGVRGAVVVVVGGLLLAMVCIGYAVRVVDRRASPYWGRFFDIVEFLLLAATFPLAAVVMGLPGLVRGLGG